MIPVRIEQRRVTRTLYHKIHRYGRKYERRDPHTHERTPRTLLCHLLARDADDVIYEEEGYRDDDGHTQTALTYDGPERCPDKEKYQYRHWQRQLAVPVGLTAVELVQGILGGSLCLLYTSPSPRD